MKVGDAIAHILKLEGTEFLFAYPVNPLIESAAKIGIRPIIVRQERIGLHMADALSRLSSGKRIGVFCMQSGPGTENAFGGVAQAFGDSHPIIVLPMGFSRKLSHIKPNFQAYLNFQHITKSCETLTVAEAVPEVMRRAFTQVRNGRPGPVLVEIPGDLLRDGEVDEPIAYSPTPSVRSGPSPESVEEAVEVLLAAERPVIYAGQGVHYAEAWDSLKIFAELLEACHDEPGRQECLPRKPSAVARIRWSRHAPGRPDISGRIGCHLRHRLQLHTYTLRDPDAGRKNLHPRNAGCRGPQQGHRRRPRPLGRRGPDVESTYGSSLGSAQRQATWPVTGCVHKDPVP